MATAVNLCRSLDPLPRTIRFLSSFCPSSSLPSSFAQLQTRPNSRGADSQEWMRRQRQDPYVRRSRLESYRCRSAFKLIEIDDKYQVLSSLMSGGPGSDTSGLVVLDCGSAPGSWTQVLVRRLTSQDKTSSPDIPTAHPSDPLILSMDLQDLVPIPGAICLSRCDVTIPSTLTRIQTHLETRLVDLVVSDMAPNATGIKEVDMMNIVTLAEAALQLSVRFSRPGATFLCKLWAGAEQDQFEKLLHRFYSDVRLVKPPSSRVDSAEIFYLARNFGLSLPSKCD